MKNFCTVCLVDLGLWGEDTQTKRMCHCPQCWGDGYALGWGVLTPQAMVGAKAAQRHGCGNKPK
jgi:hypothetical protein